MHFCIICYSVHKYLVLYSVVFFSRVHRDMFNYYMKYALSIQIVDYNLQCYMKQNVIVNLYLNHADDITAKHGRAPQQLMWVPLRCLSRPEH